jgi:uncharacterized protein
LDIKNTQAAPFHMFDYDGVQYAIDIENMQAGIYDSQTYKAQNGPEPGRVKPPAAPRGTSIVNMALFVTEACNLRCVYCYENKNGSFMTEETAFQAVDWLFKQSGDMKKINISFFGGEPFLNFPLIKKTAAYARDKAGRLDKAVGFGVTTNATVLDDDVIEFIRAYDVNVQVSMDGPRELQDKQRPFADGRGSYDVILPRVKKLLAVKPDTRVHAVLVDDSKTELIKSSLSDIGFPEVTLLPASPSLFEEKPQDGAAQAKQLRKLDGLLMDLEREAQLWLKLIDDRDVASLKQLLSKSLLSQAILALLHNKKLRYACGAGIKFIAVSCAGDIYLCHRFVGQPDFKLGSIFEPNLKNRYQESPLTRVPGCAACFARYYCAGGCKHDNAGSCGSAWTPSEDICRLRRRELELAAVLNARCDSQDRAFLHENDIFPPKPCPLDF